MEILFEEPDIDYLTKHGFSCVDLHVHSSYSDGLNKIETLLKKADKNNIGISITDHNEIRGSSLAYLKKTKTMVIPAIEINTHDGPDLLAYFYNIYELVEFYDKYVKNYIGKNPNGKLSKRLTEYLDILKDFNCVKVLPHSFAPLWKNIPRYIKKNNSKSFLDTMDAIEVINGEQLRTSNAQAAELNAELNKGITGGSDAHTLTELGRVITCAKADNVEDFLNSIKKKQTNVIGKEIRFRRRILPHLTQFHKNLRFARPILKEKAKNGIIKTVNRLRKRKSL